jgi:hypothetical protein
MCHAWVNLGIPLQSLAILSVPNFKQPQLVLSLILSQVKTLMRLKSLQPSELTSALDIFGFNTWEIVGSTQATAPGASGVPTFNTITSKPVVPIVTTGAAPTGSQSAGSDRIVVSSFCLIITLLAVRLLLSPFI